MGKVLSGIVGGVADIFRAPKATNRAANHITSSLDTSRQAVQPYMESGTQANEIYQNKLLSGALGGSFQPGDLTQDPGYQFRLSEGEKALDRKALAPGGTGFFSGAALKDAQRFGQGLADQTYNDAYNRWLQSQQNTMNAFNPQINRGVVGAQQYGNLTNQIGQTQADAVLAKENQRMRGVSQLMNTGQEAGNDLLKLFSGGF